MTSKDAPPSTSAATQRAPEQAPSRAIENPLAEGRPELDDRPPILGSWRNIYAVVVGTLVALIVIFTIITKVYAP